jgi:hypothetical protein
MSGWKERLRTFDDLAPDDGVFARASQGPRRDVPDDPSGKKRLTAGIVAFAVFGAAAVFAWQALRPVQREDGSGIHAPDVVTLGEEGSVLWPERSADALAALQTDADASRGGTRWLLDPADVTDEFVSRVLGWQSDTYEVTLEPQEDQVLAHVSQIPPTCPSPAPGEAPRAVCLVAGQEDVLLAQPVKNGEGGIWTVLSVTSPLIAIDAIPGQTVTNHGSIGVHSEIPEELTVVVGSVIGDWNGPGNCSTISGTSRLPGRDGSIQVAIGSDRDLGTDCGESAPGYAWVATATWDIHAGADPLVGDSTSYVAVTAVPINVSIPENAPAEGSTSYVDALEWRVDYPSDWTVTPISTQDKVAYSGAAFSNVDPGVAEPNSATPSPIAFDPATMPSDAVEVVITHRAGGPAPDRLSDDTPLPVTLDDLGCSPPSKLLCGAQIRGNGLDYAIEVRRGADASGEDIAAAEALVASLRFPSLRGDDVAAGLTSLGPTHEYKAGRGTPTFVSGPLGVVYVMRGPNGTYVLDLDPDACGEGENQTWDPATLQIWVQCPDYLGTGDVRYDRFGQPDPRNAPEFQTPLKAHPVITAWDGTLLVDADTIVGGLARSYWP